MSISYGVAIFRTRKCNKIEIDGVHITLVWLYLLLVPNESPQWSYKLLRKGGHTSLLSKLEIIADLRAPQIPRAS